MPKRVCARWSRLIMSNATTFLWLFVYVQAGFIAVDLYEHWRLARKDGTRRVVRANAAVILGVAAACIGYSVIQLTLASALPNIGKLADLAMKLASIVPPTTTPSLRWAVPVYTIAFAVGTLF